MNRAAMFAGKSLFALMFTVFSSMSHAALNIAVEVSSSPADRSELLMVRLTVTNPGASVANGVRVELPYPSGLAVLSDLALSDGGDCTNEGGSSAACESGETAFWNLGSIPAGTGKTVYLTPAIRSDAVDGSSIPFNARALESGVQQATAAQSVIVSVGRMLALSVDASQNPVAPSGTLSYELVYGHRGGSATTSTTLRFPIPAGTSFVSATDGGNLIGGEVVWNIGLLNPGDHGRRRVTVQLGAGAVAGSILRVEAATITGDADFLIQSARVPVATRIEVAPQLEVAITTSSDPTRSDEFLHTHLTVTNRTAAVMTGVRLEMFYPSGLLALNELAITDAGDCNNIGGSSAVCESGETASWTIGTLLPGTGKTVSLTPTARDTNPNGLLIPLIARAFSDSARDRWERRTVAYRSDRRLLLTAHAEQEPVAPNNALSYELVYGHRGGSATTSTTLRFPIPAGTSFVSATDGGNLIGGEVVWNIGLLNPGDHGRRRVTVQLGAGAVAGSILRVEAATITGDADFLVQSARAPVATRVEVAPQLEFAITTSSDPTRSDEFLHTHLTVTNRTAAVMTGVRLEMFYPSGLLALNELAITDAGDCNNIGGSSAVCESGETAFWTIGTLPPGTGKTVSLTPTARDTNPNGLLIPLIARAFSDSARDRWERRTVAYRSDRRLLLTAHAEQEPVAPNNALSYELVYGHRGGSATTSTTLRFPIPAGTSFVSATDGGNPIGGEVVWNIGLLNPGDHGRRRVTVQLGAGAVAGSILRVEAATITGDADFLVQSARAPVATRVEVAPQLEFAITTSSDPTRSDEFLHTHLTVTNRTAAVMTGVRLEMFYPSGLLALNELAITDAGDCNNIGGSSAVCESGETAFWTIGTLPPGTGKTVSLTPTARNTNPNSLLITLIARAFSDSARDRWERRTVIYQAAQGLRIVVDLEREPLVAGPDLNYTLTFGNISGIPAQNTVLRFPLPSGSTFVSADGGGTLSNGDVNWTVGLLGQGQGSRRTVTVRPTAGLAAGTLLEVNAASLSSTSVMGATAGNVARVRPDANLDLFPILTPLVLQPGNSFNATLTVDNRAASTMTGVRLDLFYAAYLNSLDINQISDGGTCNTVQGSSSSCESGETVIWNLGNLSSNASRTVGLSPFIRSASSAPPLGTIIPIYLRAQNETIDRVFLTRSLFIGNFLPIPSPEAPEIELQGNGQVIANGDSTPSLADGTDFGSIQVTNGIQDRSFTIRNLGTLPLNLTGNPRVAISGGAGDFVVTTQPTSTVSPGGTTIFIVRFDSGAAGPRTATVSISNSDADENPYTFQIRGTGIDENLDRIFGNGFEMQTFTQPPVITGLPTGTQTLLEDGSAGPFSFTISDPDTAVTSVTVSGSSNNPTLIPNGNVVFGGSGANRTLSITPAANANGNAIITVTANDGTGNTDVETVNFSVTAVNDAPSFVFRSDCPVKNGTWNTAVEPAEFVFPAGTADTKICPNFTVPTWGPADESGQNFITPASAAVEIVSNSNPAVFTQQPRFSTATNQLDFRPNGSSGNSDVTIRIRDNGGTANGGVDLSATRTFRVRVQGAAPTMSAIATQTIFEDTTTGSLALTLADADTAPGSLVLSISNNTNPALIPNGNIVLGGSGASRTVSFTPLPDQFGVADITLAVSDGAQQTQQVVQINVTAVNDPPSFNNLGDVSFSSGEPSGLKSISGWASAISVGPPNESAQVVDLFFVEVLSQSPGNFLTGTPQVTSGGNLRFNLTSNGGLAFDGHACLRVTLFDSGPDTPPNQNASTPVVLKVQVGPGSFSCGSVQAPEAAATDR